MYTNKLFSATGFWDLLRDACAHFKQGGFYELALDCFEFFINKHQAARDYDNLSRCFREMQLVSNCIHTTQRLFGKYYRVGFFGTGWEAALQGKEFIYKEKSDVVAQMIKERLVNQFGKKYPPDRIQVLPNTTQVTDSTIPAGGLGLQIVSVFPYFTQADLTDRLTEWEQAFNVTSFWFSVPFTTDGSKPSEDFSKQCVRKTILTTEKPFPFVQSRLLVKSRKIIELSPIQTATEMILEKTIAIRAASVEAHKSADGTGLRSEKEACNVLQQLLQGAVLTMVNAGPFALATLFLSEPTKFDRASVITFRATFVDFLAVINEGLVANRRVVSGDLIPFQEECEKSYHNLKEKFQPLLDSTATFV